STFRGNPLWPIAERIPATLVLMLSAIAVTIVVGIPAGVVAGAHRNRWPDLAISFTVVGLLAIPNFWLGMLLIAFLSVDLGLLPSFGADGPASLRVPTLSPPAG